MIATLESIQEDIADCNIAVSHDGNCQCWRCLHWWATISNPIHRKILCPVDETEIQQYLTNGFVARVYDDHFTALITVRNGLVFTDAPTIQNALSDLGCSRFSLLETYAAAHGWQIEHPYTKVRTRHGKVD